MKAITLAKRVANELGVYATTAKKWGLDLWADVGRIRPWEEYRTVLDVGGHYGESAIVFAARAPQARIFTFEPHPENVPVIRSAIRQEPSIHLTEALVGATAGHAPMYHWRSLGIYAMHDDPNDPGCPMVANLPVITVDEWCAEDSLTHVDFLKTDTEGHDLDVLRGAERLLRSGRIDTIVSEFGVEDADAAHTNLFEIIAYLKPLGYRLIWLYDPDIRPDGGWHVDYGNALFTRL